MDNSSNADIGVALMRFNNEAIGYVEGISDAVAHQYAMEYTRLLESRAKGMEGQRPRIMPGLFEPNRNLIQNILDGMFHQCFPGLKLRS